MKASATFCEQDIDIKHYDLTLEKLGFEKVRMENCLN